MRLTVIGCKGAYPDRNGATSGYLIEHKNTKLLIDCGSGVLSRLQNHMELFDLEAVVLSHFHRDHCADMECLQYASMIDMMLGRRKAPLYMWGGGTKEEENILNYNSYCIGRDYSNLNRFEIGTLTFNTCANVHEGNSYCIKIQDSDGKVLVYSGDTEYNPGIIDFAKNADCFLCEASLYGYQQGKIQGHLCSKEAGSIAAKAEVKKLILTHFPHYGDIKVLSEEAAEFYRGDILLAHNDMSIEI